VLVSLSNKDFIGETLNAPPDQRLTGTLDELHSEQEVREMVAELNRRIIEWRRIPEGPPVYLPLLDEDELVSSWRDRHAPAPPQPPALPEPPAPSRSARRWRLRPKRTPRAAR